MQQRIWGAIVLASLGWGSAGIAVRAALEEGVTPYAMVAIRSAIAAAGLLAFLLIARGAITRDRENWKDGTVMAVTNLVLPFILFTIGYQYASAGFMGLLAALIPLGTATLAHFLLPAEPLHLAKVAGLTIALAGVAFLVLSGDSGLDEGGRPLFAFVLGAAAVASVSIAGIYAKKRAHTYDPAELATTQFIISVPILVVTTLIAEGLPGSYSTKAWLLMLYLALVGSILPFLMFYWVLRHVTATKASLIGYAVPLVALLGGILILDERLQLGIAVGGALILVGVVVTDRSEKVLDQSLRSTAP
jgi:drug/metabolite transporter (DMT)-like permease